MKSVPKNFYSLLTKKVVRWCGTYSTFYLTLKVTHQHHTQSHPQECFSRGKGWLLQKSRHEPDKHSEMSLWVIKWFRMSATFKTCSKWYSTIKLPESSEHLFPVFTSFDAVVHSLFGTELLLDGKNPECIIRNFAAAWNKSLLSQPFKAHTICCHGI